MGLDMSIYKLTKDVINTEHKKDKLNNEYSSEFSKEISKILESHKEDFIKHLQKFNVETDEDNIERLVTKLIYSKEIDDKNSLMYLLFSYFPIYGILIEDKEPIYTDFMKLSGEIPTNNKLLSLNKEYELLDSLSLEREEVAYWRKYYDLNSYILDTFGGDNCEDTVLSLEDLQDIRDFIKNDNEDTTQVDKIISNFDSECTYVYHPWW